MRFFILGTANRKGKRKMDNSNMEYDYYPDEPEIKKGFSVGKIFKWVGIVFVILVYLLIMFRIFISKDTSLAKKFVWTDENVAVYNEKGGLSVYSHDLAGYTLRDENGTVIATASYKELSEDGLFKIGSIMYVQDTKEFIITVRYNDTCEELYSEKYSLDPKKGELFVFMLTDGEKTYSDYTYISDERFVYHYRRLIFKNVDLSDVSKLTIKGYCVGMPDLEKPVLEMGAYDVNCRNKRVDIRDYKPAKVDTALKTPPYVKFK